MIQRPLRRSIFPPGKRVADGGVVEVVLRMHLDDPALRQLDLDCAGVAPLPVLQRSNHAWTLKRFLRRSCYDAEMRHTDWTLWQPSHPPGATYLLLLLVGAGRLLLQMRLSRHGACCCAAAASCSVGHTSGAASRCCTNAAARTAAGVCISASTDRRRLSRLLLLLLLVCLPIWLQAVTLLLQLQLRRLTGL